MSSRKVYTKKELRFFRLAKCVDYSSKALRMVFKREWNNLYPRSPWLDNRASGSQLVGRETTSSRLYHPSYCKDYKHIKDKLQEGNAEDWDVTALVFVLKFSQALNPIRSGSRWYKINNAISKIKQVKNALISHFPKVSLSQNTFERNVDILIQAVENLLSRSDPLVAKLGTLRNESDFATDDLLRYEQMQKDDPSNLLLLEEDWKKLEDKRQPQPSLKGETRSPETSRARDNGKIISRMRHRVFKLEREVDSPSVDLFPSLSKPAIFRNNRYIRLVNTSLSLSYNFRWKELKTFFQAFVGDYDMQLFADIQLAVSLSHQSKKREALDMLDSLIPKVLQAKHGVVLHARIKMCKAHILHDEGQDKEAWREADEAETMLSLGECPEDIGSVHNIKANIILSTRENAKADRESILLHLDKCIHYCERATVDRGVTIVQATLRKALVHLGYYQHGILEDVPIADVEIAATILQRVSEKSEPLSERSKVYYSYGQSLLAYRKGNIKEAAELEDKVRRNCEPYKLRSEIQQLDMLKTLILGGTHCKS
ncbi:uncharacterized protein LOC114950113 isoform X2 [Acropora millepora]|uniref:uncharacterized protein LOC114950113 isoform X2 n=1 Tax=Acropora millepora TaxID=45264 RepID=UPI001CF1DEE7|nr:uncharacterized protein LOC114950113 isoform X2 [Acropora millepora]